MKIAIMLLYLVGIFFCFCGVLGILRMPDFYTRLQASTLNVTLGCMSIFLAIMLDVGMSSISLKILIIMLFILLTSPTASHVLIRGALKNGVKLRKSCCNEYRGKM